MKLDPNRVYKIARRAEWDAALVAGTFEGSAHDRRDGFIHLSTGAQVPGVLQRYFVGESDLLIVQIDISMLSDLRWEAGRAEVFPHHYGPVPITAMCIAGQLPDLVWCSAVKLNNISDGFRRQARRDEGESRWLSRHAASRLERPAAAPPGRTT